MKSAIDSSVIVSALSGSDSNHEACHRLLLSARHSIHSHALTETFSTLTGGRLGLRISAVDTASILKNQIAPRLDIQILTEEDLLAAYGETEARGIRGGAIYDFLHLVAARKAGAKRFHTLNLTDFLAFHRSGDPEILPP